MKKMIAILLALVMMMLCAVSGSFGETAGIAVGDIVTFGRYPQTAEGTDETPIEWIVLEVDEENHKALLLSKYGLDAVPYNKEYTEITWEQCTLRAWLNGEFLSKAFSPEEQTAILLTDVDNSKAQCYNNWRTDGGNNTQDQVFLLSYAEANRYLGVTHDASNNTKSRVAPTAYAISHGAWADDSKQTADGEPAGWWWLRSPGYYQTLAACVLSGGSLLYYNVNRVRAVVRPVFWLNLESELFKTDGPTSGVAPQAEAEPFVFRNGVTWGMSKAELRAYELGVPKEEEANGFDGLIYDQIQISKFEGQLIYLFSDDALVLCGYMVDGSEEGTYDYLKQAYSAKYGESKEGDGASMFAVSDRINPDFSKESNLQRVDEWKAGEDTHIWMYMENNSSMINIVYAPDSFINPPEPEIDMTGI